MIVVIGGVLIAVKGFNKRCICLQTRLELVSHLLLNSSYEFHNT